ncbi:hypothetical protein P879_02735 [Paragonimus westermani]|uniref:Kinesin-associated protein 3 n=1 Tax=Paragonimus westermani TaxID=34504 RepID=A0A8T0DXI4_9TREM|nr:hypothetical protein P879_02735 [Paragonimus westermani]
MLRKIRGGSIDVHPTEKALVVHYETEATILGELGNPMVGDRKESQKIIRVKNLNENTDIPELARKIVDNCKLISDGKLSQVEHLLRYLLRRKDAEKHEVKSSVIWEKLADPGAFDSTETEEVAHLTDLDEYLELLYEDIPEKLRASALVLQLARNPDNLEELYQNGALTMTIIEHELQKYDLWMEELKMKERAIAELTPKSDAIALEEARSSYESSVAKFTTLTRKQEQLFRVSFYLLLNIGEDLGVEVKMHNKGIVSMICRCLDRDNFELLILLVSFLKKLSIFKENKNDMLENGIIERITRILYRTEEDLVNIALRLLFNLSFDVGARREMVAKGLITRLVDLLDDEGHRPVALYVLYHLSTEDDSKKEFANTRCLSALMKIAFENPNNMTDLVPMALAINLACDPQCASLLAEGKGVRLLMRRALKMRDPLLMKLLRNISQHGDELKMKFVDYLPELAKIVIFGKVDGDKLDYGKDSTLKGAINPRHSNGCEPGSHYAVSRGSVAHSGASHNTAMFDLLRTGNQTDINANEHEDNYRDADEEDDFKAKDEDFVLECLGCLANLNLKDLDYCRILTELKLLDWIKDKLLATELVSVPKIGKADLASADDVILEIIRLLGTVCQDFAAAKLVSEANLVEILIRLLNIKQEDDEIVCQIIHVFYQLVYHTNTIEAITRTTQAPAYLIDLMHDKNAEIRRLCDLSLDIISEYDLNWGSRIQAERFRWHNSQWLEMIESDSNQPTLIRTDPTTDAVMAAALSAGHARAQYRRHGILAGDELVLKDNEDELDEATGPFGMGMGIDDATAFLMSLPSGNMSRKSSADVDRPMGLCVDNIDYINQLELMYPDMYGDVNFLGTEVLSPALSRSSTSTSDSDPTATDLNNPPFDGVYGRGDPTRRGMRPVFHLDN